MTEFGSAAEPQSIAAAVLEAARGMVSAMVCCTALPGVVDARCDRGWRPADAPDAALARVAELARLGSRACAVLAAPQLAAAVDRLDALSRSAIAGGLVLAIADPFAEPGARRSAGARLLARIAGLPLLEPADPDEGRKLARLAFDLAEEFCCPVLIRLPAECDRQDSAVVAADCEAAGADLEQGWATVGSVDLLASARARELANFSNVTDLNTLSRGPDRRLGFVTAGPADRVVREAFPRAPIVKMGLSYPLPMKHLRGLAEMCRAVVVVAADGALIETELRGEGFRIEAHNPLPGESRLSAALLSLALTRRGA